MKFLLGKDDKNSVNFEIKVGSKGNSFDSVLNLRWSLLDLGKTSGHEFHIIMSSSKLFIIWPKLICSNGLNGFIILKMHSCLRKLPGRVLCS